MFYFPLVFSLKSLEFFRCDALKLKKDEMSMRPCLKEAEHRLPESVRSIRERKVVGLVETRLATFFLLFIIITGFMLLEGMVPLRTAIKIGADEDFEISKAVLVLKGYKLYTEIWNDQPPLYTSLLTKASRLTTTKKNEAKQGGEVMEKWSAANAILGPRLVTVGFSILLISAFFLLIYCVHSSFPLLPSFKSPLAIAAIAALLL